MTDPARTESTPTESPPTPLPAAAGAPPADLPPAPPGTGTPRHGPEEYWSRRGRQIGDAWELLVGLVILAVGIWFFADVTLGLDLPRIQWGDLWPVVLIVAGGAVLLGSRSRSA